MMPSRDRERELLAEWFDSVHFDEAADWRAAEPSDDEDDEAPIVAAARPRDGDGDGFVYDNTPRMRPWNPVTDAPYPDGVIPEKAKKVVQRNKVAPKPPGPDRPIERREAKSWHDPVTAPPPVERAAIEKAFAYDDGTFYAIVRYNEMPYADEVKGSLYKHSDDSGDLYAGYFDRAVDVSRAGNFTVVQFNEMFLDPKYQGQGLGSRLFASQVDGLRTAGVDRIDVEAVSDRSVGTNGAYTWARAGYDWKPGSRNHQLQVAARIEHAVDVGAFSGDPTGTAEALDMARRLRSLVEIPGGDLSAVATAIPDDFPTPNDVAMIGWTPGATGWFGKDLLTGAYGNLSWRGSLHLNPDRSQLDIGGMPNPFATVDRPGEASGSPARPVGVTPDGGDWTDSWGEVGRRRVGNRNRWVDEQTNTHRMTLPDGTKVFLIVDVETGRRGVADKVTLQGDKNLGLQATGQLRNADAQWIVTQPDGIEVNGEVDGFLPGETAEEFTARAKALALGWSLPSAVPEVDTPDAPTDIAFYEVGGAVRDDFMGIRTDDVDFAVTAPSYDAMKEHLEAQGFRIFQERPEFATIKAKVPDGHPLQERTLIADFVLARRDGPSSDGRRPDYTEPGTLEDDLARRDFTVNAIARDIDGNIIDPHGGIADIESRTLRFVGNPMDRVNEDGLRVLRGFRFMVTKQLTPDPETWRALTSDIAAERLAGVSDQRVANELDKMLDYDTPGAVALLGQLSPKMLDAIFRDGVRLSSNRKQVKGLTRDPDLPRNPFIPTDNGEAIELGSGPNGWERVPEPPGPAVPIDREDLPPRNLDWRPPASPALSKALSVDLPNGYRVQPPPGNPTTKSRYRGLIYAPNGDEVGFVNWEVREASPTAYLSTISINPEHQGKGVGAQLFVEQVDGLRSLGVDTIELLALSDRNNNGAYTWARAGFDWEPGDWSVSELGEQLNAVSWDRDGEYPDADLLAARRIGRQLAAIDELPYDPADYPEDLPTPNDVAMIGWTPGATSWLGRDFMSGNLPPENDPLAAVVWSGTMRVDPAAPAGDGAPVVAATRPRDGDGDGFVYDDTPRMRPWNPVTDVAYPDGVIPEKAKRVITRGKRAPFTPTDRPGDMGGDVKAAPEKPPKPELSRTIDETKVLDYVEETVPGLGDIKVLVKGSDVSWDPTNQRWVEQHNLVISAKYREHNLVVDYYASDPGKTGRTVKVSWLARRSNLDPSDPSDLSGGDDSTAGPPDVPPVVGYAFWEAAQAIDEALLGDVPPSPDTLAAEDMAPDSASWWKKILQDGPLGWTDITSESPMSVDDRLAIMRYRESVTRYGDLLREGEEPQDALRQVAALSFDLDPDSMPRDWRDVIEGRGYLSANLRALQGEPGFGEPDPDAIRFLQILREDFLAKTEQVPWRIHVDPDVPPMTGVRLYRASDNPDPWGGNDPTRFSSDAPRQPSSGVTSWAFMSGDDAKRQLPSYGSIVHGVDVPFDRVIGRFGAVKGELLVANDPELVRKIDEFNTGPARDRALDVLATLPDDPFAAPELRLSASERDGMASSLDYWVTTASMAPMVKRRFPELSDDDARKIALLGGVPENADGPWAVTPEWVSEVPWPRLRDFAVDTIFRQRDVKLKEISDDERIQLGGRALAMLRRDVATLHPSGDRTEADEVRRLAMQQDWLRPTESALGGISQGISVLSGRRADTELTDADRANLKAVTDAGRILLSDLRSTVAREGTLDPDGALAYDPIDVARLQVVAETAEARTAQAQLDARAFIEANAEAWIAEVSPGTPDWPVGPLRWVPVENGLIDVKDPKFDDAEGRRFKMESRDYDGDSAIDAWDLVDLGAGNSLGARITPETVRPGDRITSPSAMAAEASLMQALDKVEEARVEWWRAKEAREELADYDHIDSGANTDTVKGAELFTRGQLRTRLNDWFGVTAKGERRVSSFGYMPGAFPDAGDDMNEVKRLGDAAVTEVAQALAVQRVRLGKPELSGTRGDTATIQLDTSDLLKLGWGAGEVRIQPRGESVDIILDLWREGVPTSNSSDARISWFDRGSSNPGFLAQRLGALRRRKARLDKRATEGSRQAIRDWATETLDASTPPALRDDQPVEPVRVGKLMENVTPFIPDSLKWAAGPVQVGPSVDPRSSYSAQEPGGTPVHRLNMYHGAKDQVYLHEYGHHVERIGVIGKAVWAFYQHRTAGEDTVPLGGGYKESEVTRPDDFYSRYAGKDYGNGLLRSKSGQTELFTMGLEGLFFGSEGDDGRKIDDEHAAFILGTLLHAGERAKKYAPDTRDSGDSDGPIATFPDAKDLNDLLNERAAERPRRTRFGRVFVEGVANFGGDSNPFTPEDIVDADNPVDLGSPGPPLTADVVEDVYKLVNSRVRPEPVAIPNTPNIFTASQVERSEVVALVKNPDAPEEVAGANEAIREAVRHTQRSLRAAGVETVTLYRGASPFDDPFRRQPGASGVTSWTADPAKAWTYADDAFVVYRAEVPVENILSYDVIGLAATASTSQTRPLTGREVLVVADPSIVEALAAEPVTPEGGVDLLDLLGVNRVTPATMEGNGTGTAAPAV
jgi:GNAT superfamily N-acetyltransferase